MNLTIPFSIYSVANAPIITAIHRTATGILRVEWSQPTGGAPVTKYIIHYTDSNAINANAGSNSVDISDLNDGEVYTVTVEARSEHLSGESEPITITLGRYNSLRILYSS